MSSITDRMLTGSAWLSGARLLTNGLAFVSTFLMARLLAPEDFGLVAIGTSIQMIALAITEMSMAQALIQHRDPTENHYHTAWTLGMGRGVVLGLILVLLAQPMADIYDDVRLANVIYTLALGIIISGMGNPRLAMMERDLIFWQQFVLSVTGKVTYILASVTIAVILRSYWALIAGMLAAQIVNAVLSYVLIPFRPRFSLRHLGEMWSFSVWLSLGKAVNTINWRFDQLLVGNILGQSVLGLYSVGSNLAQLPTREALAPINATLFPALSRITDDSARLYQAFRKAQSVLIYAALPLGLSLSLVAEPLIVLAMGEKWLGAVPVVQVLTVVFALQTFGSMVQPLGMATGHTRLLFWRDLQMFGVRLPVIVAGTVLYGLPGLIYSRVLTGLIAAGVNMVLVRRILGMSLSEQVAGNWRSLAGAIGMAGGTLAMQAWLFDSDVTQAGAGMLLGEVALSLAFGFALYIGTSFLLWWAVGRPEGAERQLLGLGGKLVARIRRRA